MAGAIVNLHVKTYSTTWDKTLNRTSESEAGDERNVTNDENRGHSRSGDHIRTAYISKE